MDIAELSMEDHHLYVQLVLLGLFETAAIFNHQARPSLYISKTSSKAWFNDYDNYLSGMEMMREFLYSLFVEN